MRFLSFILIFIFSSACAVENEQVQEGQITEQVPSGAPWFANEAVNRGFSFAYDSGFTGIPHFPEIMGGGAALFDVDGDDDLDLYVVQGGDIREIGSSASRNVLFLNDGTGNFIEASSLSGAGDTGYGMGVTTGDYDNDGDVDLYITNVGRNTLLNNRGDGTFMDMTAAAGVGHEGWGASSTFFDMENDGDLDLFVTNYIDWNLGIDMACDSPFGIPDYCSPNAYDAPSRDVLFQNDGNGTFTDISSKAGLHSSFGNGLGVVVGDVQGDGFVDVFVANDQNHNQLWINQKDGTFLDKALISGVAVDQHGEAKAGMGTDILDIDDDGDLDLFVVNLAAQSDSLFINEGGWFTDGTAKSGLAGISRPFTRFGTGFFDFDNDGFLDVYMANGKVLMSAAPGESDVYAEENLLIKGNRNGTFTEVFPRGGVQNPLIHTSRGTTVGDIDNDGRLDIVVINRDAPAYLLMNQTESANAVSLKLVDRNQHNIHHATVKFLLDGKQKRRDVKVTSGYCGAHDPRLHIGLGDASHIQQVEIVWPDKSVTILESILAGKHTIYQH